MPRRRMSQRVRHEWGLDQPLLVQYWQFISRALVGDFGKSLKFGEPVIKSRFRTAAGDHRAGNCELAAWRF